MNRVFLYLLLILSSCVDTPKLPELSDKSKSKFHTIRNYLECENIRHSYHREVTSDHDWLDFSIDLYDVKAKDVNFDSINKEILSTYKENGLKIEDCYRVSIFYFNNYSRADLRVAYFFDSTRTIVKVAYD